MKNKSTYFLGTNTPNGFYSLFSELYDPMDNWRAYIIKGGPGTGKSRLMKSLAAAADEKNLRYEKIFCSSDPDSLDGIIFHELKICIADGTAPHVLEPKFPGAVEEIINVGEFWNSAELFKNAESIISVCARNSECHKKCVRDLKAIDSLTTDNLKLAEGFINTNKVTDFAGGLISKEIPFKDSSIGCVKKRFLSGITPLGPLCFWDTVHSLADRIIVLDDDSLFVSSIIIEMVKNSAVNNGYDVILCPDPLLPGEKSDHIIIPELKLAVVTSTEQYKFTGKCESKVRFTRFASKTAFKDVKNEFEDTLKLIEVLYERCTQALFTAKKIHDELEAYYISNMDFDRLNQSVEELIKKILK